MRGKRPNQLPGFKSKVALAAIKGDRTLAELSEQFDVHQNEIQDWRMIFWPKRPVVKYGRAQEEGGQGA